MPLRALSLLAALLAMTAGGPAHALELPAPQPSEQAVKAAFLPKFARYVELPAAAQPEPGQPLLLCVIGRDPLGKLLDQAAASETGEGRALVVRRMPDAAGAHACHILFVHGASELQTAQLLQAVKPYPLLTVTDFRGGRARGMIHFVMVSGRVRFQIDEAEAARRGIAISSRLLALAVDVRQR